MFKLPDFELPEYKKALERANAIVDGGELPLRGGLSSYGFVSPDDTYFVINTACYYGVSYLGDWSEIMNDKPLFMVDYECSFWDKYPAKHEDFSKESAIKYIDWVINQSNFSQVFLTEDPEKVFTKGAVMTMHMPCHFNLYAGMALRYVSEYTDRLATWEFLKDYIEPHVAWLLIHSFVLRKNHITYSPLNGSHAAFNDCYLSKNGVARFLSMDFYRKDKSFSKKARSPSQMVYLFTKNGEKPIKWNSIGEAVEDYFGNKVLSLSMPDTAIKEFVAKIATIIDLPEYEPIQKEEDLDR